MADIGDRIKELRLANHMTQDELAKKLYITRSAVGMYEQGVRRPDFEHMDAMADLFNVSLDYLMGKTDTNIGYPRHFAEALIDATPKPMLMREAEKRAQAYFKGMTAAEATKAEKIEKIHQQILEAYDAALPPVKAAVLRLLDIEG